VRPDVPITKMVLRRIAVFLSILMDPVSFIKKPTWERITMIVQISSQTLSRIVSKSSNLAKT